jgi:hypothetical protein
MNKVKYNILRHSNNANMLDDEGRRRVSDKLGIVRAEDGSWAFNKSESKTDGERAMSMVVNQRLRNKSIKSNKQNLKEVLKQDGPAKTELMKYGMDELVLDLFMQESAQDCGRVFQERVRREIITERIKEIRSLDESRTPYTVATERYFQVAAKVGAEIAYFVQDMSNLMNEIHTSLLDRVKPGGFLAKVMGGAASVWRGVADISKEITDGLPSDFVDVNRTQQRRGPLNMPDLFAEFED